jgi:hypothetical protein
LGGQVTGDTAKQISDRFGKTMQEKTSLTINSVDTSLNKSKQFDQPVPPSVISGLSSGEFVGIVVDNPTDKIPLKAFHCEIENPKITHSQNRPSSADLQVIRMISKDMILTNYKRIKDEAFQIAESVIEQLQNDPKRAHLMIRKGDKN